MTNIKSLAIIAGRGDFPNLAIEKCIKENIKFQLFLLHGEDYSIDYSQHNPTTLKYGQISQLIEICKDKDISDILMIGAVTKPDFKSISVDKKSAILLTKILAKKILGDDAVLSTVTKFFENEGFNIVKIDEFLDDLFAKKGCITSEMPSKEDLKNIDIAKTAIKELSHFDVGQSIAIAQKQIIAVEAAEGTDQMIKRVKDLNIDYKNSAILVKLSKSGQSAKVDLPTIGINTIKECINSNIKGIAIESQKTLIVNKNEVIDYANQNNIFIYAI